MGIATAARIGPAPGHNVTEARSPDPIFVFQGFQAPHFRLNVGLILRCSPQALRQSRLWVRDFSSIHVPFSYSCGLVEVLAITCAITWDT